MALYTGGATVTNTEFTLGRTTILVGDCRAALRTLPAQSIHCAVTSPPYYGLRDYGVAGQLGLETSVDAYINAMVDVFREVWRVLRDDGTLWLNVGDSYSGSGKGPTGANGAVKHTERQGFHSPDRAPLRIPAKNLMLVPWRLLLALQAEGWVVRSIISWQKTSPMPESVTDRPTSAWEPIFVLSKRRNYFWDAEAVREPALQPLGEPKLTSQHKAAILGHTTSTSKLGTNQGGAGRNMWNYHAEPDPAAAMLAFLLARAREDCPDWLNQALTAYDDYAGQMSDILRLGPEPLADAHYAAFPTEIPRRAILAGTSAKGVCPACGAGWVRMVEREVASIRRTEPSRAGRGILNTTRNGQSNYGLSEGFEERVSQTTGWAPSCQCDAGEPIPATILDPFLGSGTSAMVANRLQRDAIGCELKLEYAVMAERRIRGDLGMLADVEVVL